MSNTIRKSALITAAAALAFAPAGTAAMADDAVDSSVTDEVIEEVESTDSSDETSAEEAEVDDSVEAEVAEEVQAADDTEVEAEVVEEESVLQEGPEPVKAEDVPSQPAQSKPDAGSKSQKKTVQDDSSTSTTSSDETPKTDEPEVISDQEDDSEPPAEDEDSESDDGTEEDSFTNVAYNHKTDHQNQVLTFDILYEYSEANDTTGWKIDILFYDKNGNSFTVVEGVQIAPAGESMSFSLAEFGPGIYNWDIYYKNKENIGGGNSTKLLVPATPVGPTQDEKEQKLIIPEDDNFDYSYTNAGMTTSIGAGSHWIGPVGEVVVTAKVKPGEVVDQNATTEWTFSFVESGNPGGDDDDGDDNTPEVTVVTPDKSWIKHTKKPGQNDDQAEVRGDYQDKVLVATVEHHDGRVDVVLVPRDGYAFPDDADHWVVSFDEFVESDDTGSDGDDKNNSGDNDGDGDDNTGNGDDDSDDNTNSGSDDSDSDSTDGDGSDSDGDNTDDDTTAGSDGKDDDSDDSDSDSKKGDDKSKGSDSDSKDNDATKDGSNDDSTLGGDDNVNSNSSGKKGTTGGDTKSGRSGDKSKSGDLNENFEAHTGVEDFPVWSPIAGVAMLLAAATGITFRYRQQK